MKSKAPVIKEDLLQIPDLEEQQALFASIVNSSDDAILSKTLDGIITSWNRGAGKIFGWAASEIIGKHVSILIPADLTNEENEIIRRIRNGKSIHHYETRRIRKDGSTIHVSLTVSPVKDSSGNITGASKIARDITKQKKAEEELIKANQEKETLLNRISDGVVSVDNEWRYTFLNDAAMATHPQSKEKTLGKIIWDVHPEMKGTLFWDKYHEAMETRKVVEIEDHYTPMDIWFSVKVYPSSDGLTIFYKNITESKKTEQQLSQRLKDINDYRFALDESSIVAITDQKGIIQHANDNFCKISKYSREELIGQDHRLINSGHHSKEFIRNLWVTIANGKIWKGELKNKAKDGTIYWVDTTIVPFLTDEGKPYQYIAIRSDITERKKVEDLIIANKELAFLSEEKAKRAAELIIANNELAFRIEKQEKQAAELLIANKELVFQNDEKGKWAAKLSETLERVSFLASIADNIQDPVISTSNATDNNFVITRWNKPAELLLEWTSEEVIGKNVLEIFRTHYPYDTREQIFEGLKTNGFWQGEVIYHTKSGKPVHVLSSISHLKDGEGRINGNLVLIRDISKRKQAEEALSKLNEELEAFTYSVSHDLRAPLRGIIGFTSILEEDYTSKLDDEAKRITKVIKDNTTKMGNLIDDLLTFSRTGKLELTKTPIDTGVMIKEILAEFTQQDKLMNIDWDIHNLPPVKADSNMIRQVWINFISNAIKYSGTKKKPLIEIGSSSEDGQTIFYIRDNGVGFDEQYKQKLFKVFQRLHNSEEFEGTGVGLALVEKIVSRHGGKVWAEGNPGKGACFYFSLPA